MKEIFTTRFLSDADLTSLHQAFLKAFSDYAVNMKASEEQFRGRLARDGVKLSRSVGAFSDSEMVGFSLNGYGRWQERVTAYDAGTGILPAYRGRGLASKLFEFMLPELRKDGVEQCLLEVLSTNLPAVRLYQKLGFIAARNLEVFEQAKIVERPKPDRIKLDERAIPDWPAFQRFWDGQPSWQNSIDAIERLKAGVQFVSAYVNGKCAGYGVLSTTTGNLMQLAVAPANRRQGVGSAILMSLRRLLPADMPLRVTNVDAGLSNALAFYEASGFTPVLEQIEMILRL